MKAVIKIGGAALEDESLLHGCARAVVNLAKEGHRLAVVHGGGAALTRSLQRLGKKSEFIHGRRVTDLETRDVALMVLAGLVNKKLAAAISAAGSPGFGFCGGDGMAFQARRKNANGCDLGYVGEIVSAEPRWIEAIWREGGIPVISSLALGDDGEYYNTNADEMAAACAVTCKASALIFLTDVPGVKDASGAVLHELELAQVPVLTADGVLSGGMLPKLDACSYALRHGVDRVCIFPAREVHQLNLLEVEFGTEVLSAEHSRNSKQETTA